MSRKNAAITEAELIRRGILNPMDPEPFPGRKTGYQNYAAGQSS